MKPPTSSVSRSNCSGTRLRVDLNIICSNRWAKPERPRGSSLRADIVPDLDRDVGAVRIADRIDAQAVGERAASDRRSAARAAAVCGRGRRRAERTQAAKAAREQINASSSPASRARALLRRARARRQACSASAASASSSQRCSAASRSALALSIACGQRLEQAGIAPVEIVVGERGLVARDRRLQLLDPRRQQLVVALVLVGELGAPSCDGGGVRPCGRAAAFAGAASGPRASAPNPHSRRRRCRPCPSRRGRA